MIDNDDLTTNTAELNGDGQQVANLVRKLAAFCRSPYTDGFTQCTCKHQIYLLKCLIEDVYSDLPDFPQQEKEWEQERLIQLLKRK